MKGQIAKEEIGSEILRSFFWEFKGPNFEAGAKTLSSVVINSLLFPFRSQSTLCKWQPRNSVDSWKYNTVYNKSYYYMKMNLHRDINKDKAKTWRCISIAISIRIKQKLNLTNKKFQLTFNLARDVKFIFLGWRLCEIFTLFTQPFPRKFVINKM